MKRRRDLLLYQTDQDTLDKTPARPYLLVYHETHREMRAESELYAIPRRHLNLIGTTAAHRDAEACRRSNRHQLQAKPLLACRHHRHQHQPTYSPKLRIE